MTPSRHSRRTTRLLAGAAAAALALVTIGATAASAKGGDAVRSSGQCSMSSTWKLKAKPDDGRLQVELEVDQNKVGRTWQVVLTDNGTRVFAGTATTTAPSGSFTVERRTANLAGTDRIVARATDPATGETCRGVVTL